MLNRLSSLTGLLFLAIGLLWGELARAEVVWVVRVCFSNETFVEAASARSGFEPRYTLINKLRDGDFIKTFDQESNKFVYSRFIDYMHYDQTALVEYMVLNTVETIAAAASSRRSLTKTFKPLEITGYHLMKRLKRSVRPSSVSTVRLDLHVDDFEFVFAKEVEAGDHVLIEQPGQESVALRRVASIDRIERHGSYAPLTEHGTLLVNGVHVSCYGNLASHGAADLAFLPLKVWTKYVGKVATCSSTTTTTLRAAASEPIVYMNAFTKFLYSIAVNIPLGSMLVL